MCLSPEILAADKQLAEEIEFDLKRVEEEQRRAARAPNTPLPDTPHAQMVSREFSSVDKSYSFVGFHTSV